MGLKTGFEFGKGSYGPFAAEVKIAINDFANRNWLQEEQLGRMMTLRVGEQFEIDRRRFSEVLSTHSRKIAKTVDLFSRIKDTEQAEELITVFYASRELKRTHPNEEIAEQQVYDYVLDWKKSWREDSKQKSLAGAIRNLASMGWMKLQFSESLPEPA